MLHLLDANVLIDANRDYYPADRVPEFWRWLLHECKSGNVKVPNAIYDEVMAPSRSGKSKKSRTDLLIDWMRKHRSSIVLNEVAPTQLVQKIVRNEYVVQPTASQLLQLGGDPILISHAYQRRDARTVVTTERSKSSTIGVNRKVPDVCDSLGVKWIHTYKLIRDLDFRTGWSRQP